MSQYILVCFFYLPLNVLLSIALVKLILWGFLRYVKIMTNKTDLERERERERERAVTHICNITEIDTSKKKIK